MSSVLIVGNVVKDVYLNLDERQNNFELDGENRSWLDIAFDGSRHPFFRRTSVFGGAAVTLEVLNNFGLDAKISGVDFDLEKGAPEFNDEKCHCYRYILCRGDEIAYLVPSERAATPWKTPRKTINWIFIDRSAEITDDLLNSVKSYLTLSEKTRLAIYLSAEPSKIELELAKVADLVFTENPLSSKITAAVCKISEQSVSLGAERQKIELGRLGLKTHLTAYSVIAGSIFGALNNGKSPAEALKIAKINVERATLSGTEKYNKLEELAMEAKDSKTDLRFIAASLVDKGKGILAADESGGSIHKKFEAAGIPDDEDHRRDYRNIFFTTPDLEKYANGVILFDETARQKADDGRDFVAFLTARGVIPGVKVDQGLVDFPEGAEGEKITSGLESLPERLKEYYEMGLRFAKWRAAFEIRFSPEGERLTPTDTCIVKNCEILARYAKDCQEAGIVPIVEPEVVYDGDYGPEVSAEVTARILDQLFLELAKIGVDLKGCLLKCNMVLAGKRFGLGPQSTPEEVGRLTATVLKEHVPEELAGVVFLSGGQSVEQATANLQAITNNGPFPWPVTFSFARALQDPALDAWNGDNKNAEAARAAFLERLKANAAALTKREGL